MKPRAQADAYTRAVARMDGRARGQAFAVLAGIVLVLLWACGAFGAPPALARAEEPDFSSFDQRLTALERRVADLYERLDRPAPSAGGTEAQSATTNFVAAPQAAYTAACGPGGCGPATQPFTNPTPFQGAFYGAGPVAGFQGAGGGCAGGSCGAQAPAGGFLRGGLFGRRR